MDAYYGDDYGQPGNGCRDPRDLHRHHCAACGFELTFSAAKCRALPIVPHCEVCGANEWRYEIDPRGRQP